LVSQLSAGLPLQSTCTAEQTGHAPLSQVAVPLELQAENREAAPASRTSAPIS
jgi:hypothetical protein